MIKVCVCCDSEYHTSSHLSKYCNKKCKSKSDNDRYLQKRNNNKNKDDIVTCRLCEKTYSSLTNHLVSIHNINSAIYIDMFPGSTVVSKNYSIKASEKIKGDKNPGYKHGGKLSPWSSNSMHHTQEQIQTSKEAAKTNYTRCKRNNCVEYYTSRGYTEDDARKLISERQRTFTLEKCIQKLGEEEGRKRHADRQHKWHKNFKKSNYSKISQELFWSVYSQIKTEVETSDVYFASYNNGVMDSERNFEYVLKLESTSIKVDFIVLSKKIIIEFDGDYWHNLKRNEGKDIKRDVQLGAMGFMVHRVKECEYNKDKDKTIKECVNLLMHGDINNVY